METIEEYNKLRLSEAFFHASNRYSAERMERLFKSLERVETAINNDYENMVKDRRDAGESVIPTYRDMLGDDGIVIVELDMKMIDFIENLLYIKNIYEKNFMGKCVRLKVGIQECEKNVYGEYL
ncbi:MAG: hypothetical protein LAN71_17205 [Acidobacteriia bacterium]|nr:hypothetical protein [Terriglobia bacterium]